MYRFWLYCLVFEIHDDEEACDPVNSMEHLNAYSTLELFEIHRVAKFLVELIAWTASVEENIPVHSPQLGPSSLRIAIGHTDIASSG